MKGRLSTLFIYLIIFILTFSVLILSSFWIYIILSSHIILTLHPTIPLQHLLVILQHFAALSFQNMQATYTSTCTNMIIMNKTEGVWLMINCPKYPLGLLKKLTDHNEFLILSNEKNRFSRFLPLCFKFKLQFV